MWRWRCWYASVPSSVSSVRAWMCPALVFCQVGRAGASSQRNLWALTRADCDCRPLVHVGAHSQPVRQVAGNLLSNLSNLFCDGDYCQTFGLRGKLPGLSANEAVNFFLACKSTMWPLSDVSQLVFVVRSNITTLNIDLTGEVTCTTFDTVFSHSHPASATLDWPLRATIVR